MMKFTMNAKELKAMMEKGLAAIDKKVTLDSLKKLYMQVEEDGTVKMCEPIGDIFKGLLEEHNIKYHYVGELKIRFGERQVDYLADYIPREIV